jgi:hypothetical protein
MGSKRSLIIAARGAHTSADTMDGFIQILLLLVIVMARRLLNGRRVAGAIGRKQGRWASPGVPRLFELSRVICSVHGLR